MQEYNIICNDNKFSIPDEIAREFGLFNGMLESGITEFNISYLPDNINNPECLDKLLKFFSIITLKNKNEVLDEQLYKNSEINNFEIKFENKFENNNNFNSVVTNYLEKHILGVNTIENYIENIENYTITEIREKNKEIFSLLIIADYLDHQPLINNIKNYIIKLLSVANPITAREWLGGII